MSPYLKMSTQMITFRDLPVVIRVSATTCMMIASTHSYADDMVLLASTTDALHDLFYVCQVYAAKHDIVYNIT